MQFYSKIKTITEERIYKVIAKLKMVQSIEPSSNIIAYSQTPQRNSKSQYS